MAKNGSPMRLASSVPDELAREVQGLEHQLSDEIGAEAGFVQRLRGDWNRSVSAFCGHQHLWLPVGGGKGSGLDGPPGRVCQIRLRLQRELECVGSIRVLAQ